MILAIDIGNTHIVLGVLTDGNLKFVSRLKADRHKTEDDYASELKIVLELYKVNCSEIEGVIISSVVPQIAKSVGRASSRLTGKTAMLVGPGIKTGLNILIDDPAVLGSDMVAEAVGAISKYEKPVIIADLGTATKIFVVDKSGSFLGCAIMPGIGIGLDALSERTATLPQISLDAPGDIIGKNSVDSMKSGIVYGTAGMIDGMVKRMEQRLGQKATVIATGGYSGDIVPHCECGAIHDPNLIFEGLYRIYCRNHPQKL